MVCPKATHSRTKCSSKIRKIPRWDVPTFPKGKGLDFHPGELLGCVSGELGFRKYLEGNGHEFVVTSSKDGDECEADKHIVDADIVISQPFSLLLD